MRLIPSGEVGKMEENPIKMPVFTSKRLILKPFTMAEAKRVQLLAGAREVAATTLNVPHPYEDGMAEGWIEGHQGAFERGQSITLAIFTMEPFLLIGAIGLIINSNYDQGSLGYWIGKDYWNRGYCTEAAKLLIDYSFAALALNRVYAAHFATNRASGGVMVKLGMKREGILRQQVKKWGEYHDLVYYGLLKDEFKK